MRGNGDMDCEMSCETGKTDAMIRLWALNSKYYVEDESIGQCDHIPSMLWVLLESLCPAGLIAQMHSRETAVLQSASSHIYMNVTRVQKLRML